MAGAVLGAWLLALERSQSYHVFASVLNAATRLLTGRIAEATLVRLDTDDVGLALYVGGHALLGAAVGGAIRSTVARLLPKAVRPVLTALALLALDVLVLRLLWSHRELPFGAGMWLLTVGAGGAAIATLLASVVFRRLTERALAILATAAPSAVVVAIVVVMAGALRGPRAADGITLDEPVREPTGVKLAILALDGLDGFLVDEALGRGRLPNLAALQEKGVRGDLRSIRPPMSPVVWTTAVTGMLPGVHGIRDFVVLRDGERVPVTSNLRRVPAIWNLALDLDFTCAFVNWYVTWPAEPTRGVVISDRVDHSGLPQRVFPEELTAVIDSVRAEVDDRPDRDIERFTQGVADFDRWRSGRWGQVRRALSVLDDVVRHDLVTLESARAVIARSQPELTALYFRGNDNTQHLFWKYRLAARGDEVTGALFPGIEREDVRSLAEVVDRYYDFIDRLVGESISMLEPGTALLILSDHGFLTNNERNRWFHANRLLEAGGFATLVPGGGGAADSAASRVWDPVAPTIDARRILRPGGRASGTGEELREAKAFLDGLQTDTGRPLFVSTALGEDERGPRLAVVFARNPEGSTVDVGGEPLALSEFHIPEGHSGDHRMNGFLLASGAPFRSGASYEGARVADIAPTVLHLLGLPVAHDMEGIPLTGLLDDAWNAAHPVRYVDSYGVREDADSEVISTEADERIREELRALGYLK